MQVEARRLGRHWPLRRLVRPSTAAQRTLTLLAPPNKRSFLAPLPQSAAKPTTASIGVSFTASQ
ncbi:MAG TPA: hypothetical protein PKL67_18105, partial [Anaerolineae bacterium]|nr:hypothetical protein [Anaerolineae bacterium]